MHAEPNLGHIILTLKLRIVSYSKGHGATSLKQNIPEISVFSTKSFFYDL